MSHLQRKLLKCQEDYDDEMASRKRRKKRELVLFQSLLTENLEIEFEIKLLRALGILTQNNVSLPHLDFGPILDVTILSDDTART